MPKIFTTLDKIKPAYDDAYSLDNFTMVEDIEEFASRSDTKEEIYDDLGL